MAVRIGMLGSGFVANFYMLGLRNLSGYELAAVCSTNRENARTFAEKWGYADVLNDPAELAGRGDLDLVILAVPNYVHRDLALLLSKHNKNMVCTKPLGRNAEEAREMRDAARAAGVMDGYAETEVFSPAVMKAQEYIASGGIGKVLSVRSREAHFGPHSPWFWDPALSGGGALVDMGCHCIEAARYFVGKDNPIVEVLAWGDTLLHDTQAEDNAVMLMRFRDGQLAQAEVSWTSRGGLDLRNEIYGTEGVIFTDVTRETPIKVFSRPGAGYVVEKAESETGWLFPPVDEAWIYGYQEEMRHFIECVNSGRRPRENFDDGLAVNQLLDAGYRSMQSKRWQAVDIAAG
jgi:predicted dehydrogenase